MSVDTPTYDVTLWRQVTHGDGAAFSLVYERHATRVDNCCFRRTASWPTALDPLPTADQELLALVAWSGLTNLEVATVLDLPIGTVKSRVSRIREGLRAQSAEPNQ